MLINQHKTVDRLTRNMFFSIALVSVITLTVITLFLFQEGIPIFKVVSIKEFLFGDYWYPTDDVPAFGILPMIIGSLSVTAVSASISIPLGIMTAIYLAEIADHRIREIVKPIIELLSALPSVVIGFFGMVIVAPLLQEILDIPTGLNLFNAGLMLAFMTVPTICGISEDAINSVPNGLKEASLALGATHWETIVRVTLPASISGISTAVILGMSRAIGETMVVLMVAGGAAIIPESLFDPVRPLPASIAAELGEAPFRGNHYHALFAIGIALFLITFAFNIVADRITSRFRQVGEASL
ncbi:phosphate ABC transporter permease subunit PstC [bacterium]|nr:phosphate ABC transporter permease subunit PstC [bacterium]